MNIKRIISLALAIVVIATTFTGCDLINSFIGSGDNNQPAGKNTLVMEAEYTDLDEVAGAGLSDGTSGLSMIYGKGNDTQKEMWSNGYYVGFMYNSNTEITFEFNSSAATTATITFSIACEQNDLVLTSGENLDILVNGVAQYFNWSVTCSQMDTAKFYTYTLTNVNLVEGANKIQFDVITPIGSLLDCVKVVASDATVELSWEPNEDNPYRRDNEV